MMFFICPNRRRESTDVEDLFIAHIAGMDTLARGLRNAAKLIEVMFLSQLLTKFWRELRTHLSNGTFFPLNFSLFNKPSSKRLNLYLGH